MLAVVKGNQGRGIKLDQIVALLEDKIKELESMHVGLQWNGSLEQSLREIGKIRINADRKLDKPVRCWEISWGRLFAGVFGFLVGIAIDQ